MANNASALKRIRQTKTRTSLNRVVKNRLKSQRKALDVAVEAGDTAEAQKTIGELFSAADRAAKKNVIHKKSASNIKAKASVTLKKLA